MVYLAHLWKVVTFCLIPSITHQWSHNRPLPIHANTHPQIRPHDQEFSHINS